MLSQRNEIVIWLFSLLLTFIVLCYCAWRITITQQWLYDHRRYIQERDRHWEPLAVNIEAHLIRQDADSRNIFERQSVIMRHQKENAERQEQILELLKARK
jgi:hypothetical protein